MDDVITIEHVSMERMSAHILEREVTLAGVVDRGPEDGEPHK